MNDYNIKIISMLYDDEDYEAADDLVAGFLIDFLGNYFS